MRFLVVLIVCAVFSVAWDSTVAVLVDKTKRTALLHVPPNAKSPMPLVFNWHGMALDAKEQRGLSDMDRVADQHGFAVVYPQGLVKAQVCGVNILGLQLLRKV